MDVVDKSLYVKLAYTCVEKLNKRGNLVAEVSLYDAFASVSSQNKTIDNRYTRLIRNLNKLNIMIAAHLARESTLIPIGDGVTMAIKN